MSRSDEILGAQVLPISVNGSAGEIGVIYLGVSVTPEAKIRPIWFRAESAEDARRFCCERGFACMGLAGSTEASASEPEAYAIDAVMRRLNLSRSSVYRLLARGELKRLRGVASVRITRRSLEQFIASAA